MTSKTEDFVAVDAGDREAARRVGGLLDDLGDHAVVAQLGDAEVREMRGVGHLGEDHARALGLRAERSMAVTIDCSKTLSASITTTGSEPANRAARPSASAMPPGFSW